MTESTTVRPLTAALWAFAIAMAAVVVLGLARGVVPFVDRYIGVAVALVFLIVPVELAWRRGRDMAAIGFTWNPLGLGAAYAGGTLAVVFPLFLFGFVWFYDLVCTFEPLRIIAPPEICAGWRGFAGASWPPLDLSFAEFAAAQVIVVAIPEELLFRGYIHDLCERAFPPQRRLLGGGVGKALILSSALFAVIHLAIGFDARRLATFFPGLVFGWLRSATGSIAAPVAVHAAANIYMALLQRIFS